MQAILIGYLGTVGTDFQLFVEFYDSSDTYLGSTNIPVPKNTVYSPADIRSQYMSAISAWTVANGLGTPTSIFCAFDGETIPNVTTTVAGLMSAVDKVKLNGLATQIQSDWNQTNPLALDFIKNKPTVGAGTVTSVGVTSTDFSISGSPITTSGSITANLNTSGVTAGTYSGVTVNSKGIVTSATNRSFNNAPGRTIVTGTGATGFQVSSTRDATVNYSATIVTTATIAGNSSGTIVLEIASTNSATAGDWVEIGRMTNGQALSLAIALQSVQTTAGQIGAVIPSGYWGKLRSISSGTTTFAVNSAQEVLL